MDHWALRGSTAPGCLLTEGNKTAEVELAVTREGGGTHPPTITCLRCKLRHTRHREDDGGAQLCLKRFASRQ